MQLLWYCFVIPLLLMLLALLLLMQLPLFLLLRFKRIPRQGGEDAPSA